MSRLLFDLDGTLTHPHEGIIRSIVQALRLSGVEPPPAARLTANGSREELAAESPDALVSSTAELTALFCRV